MEIKGKSTRSRIPIATLVSLCFVIGVFTLAFLCPQRSFAEEEPSIDARVMENNVDKVWATENSPATGRVTEYGGSMVGRFYPRVEISYSGLPGDTEYTCELTLRHEDSGQSYTGSYLSGTFTTDSSGTGSAVLDMTFQLFPWQDLTGIWKTDLKIYPASDPDDTIEVTAPDGDMSMTFDLRGVTSMSIDADGMIDSGQERCMTDELLAEEKNLRGTITFRGLRPNGTYRGTGQLRSLPFEGMMTIQDVGVPVDISGTADSEGNMTLTIPYDLSGVTLDHSRMYFNSFDIRNKDDSSDRYFYGLASFLWEVWDTIDETLPGEAVMYVVDDERPDEGKTEARVAITNYLIDDKTLLQGSVLKIVRGKDPEGTDVVDRWTHDGTIHEVMLELGDYVLVQESVPGNYKKADPVKFSVNSDDAKSRNYLFEGYAVEERSSDGSRLQYLSVRRDRSDDKGEVVFCINAGKYFGGRVDRRERDILYYYEYDITAPELAEIIQTPRLETDALRTKLKQIAYAGYPNDKAGLKSKFDLTEGQFEAVTQMAVHYYTDSLPFSYLVYYVWPYFHEGTGEEIDLRDTKIYRAFEELINTQIKTPDGMTLKIYRPTNNIYQTVLSTKFREEEPVKVITVYNEPYKSNDEVKPADNTKEKKAEEGSKKREEGNGTGDTGDDNGIMPIIIFLFIAASITVTIIITYRRRTKRTYL